MAAPNPKGQGSSTFHPQQGASFAGQESPVSEGTPLNITGQLPQDHAGAHFNPDVCNSNPRQVSGAVNTQPAINPQELQASNNNNMVPGWVPTSANQDEALGNYHPQENQNSTAHASTLKNPSPRPIPNALYEPLYGIAGMPVDPHLKALYLKEERGEKWSIEPTDS